jgi:hypothetical protein
MLTVLRPTLPLQKNAAMPWEKKETHPHHAGKGAEVGKCNRQVISDSGTELERVDTGPW